MRRTPSQLVDDATTDLMAAVEAVRDTSVPMPADLGDVFGSLGEHLRRLDHLATTLLSAYDRLPGGLRCDNGELAAVDLGVQGAHNAAARIGLA